MVEPYNLYVVGRKSYLHNTIKVLGVFPNEMFANKFSSTIGQVLDIFIVGKSQVKIGECEIEIPFNAKKLK